MLCPSASDSGSASSVRRDAIKSGNMRLWSSRASLDSDGKVVVRSCLRLQREGVGARARVSGLLRRGKRPLCRPPGNDLP
jgi:hypothetical protein